MIFPDVRKMSVVFASSAEEQVYTLAQSLPDPWRVYYSCTLSMKEQDMGVREGEIDFVFYHPAHGVIVVEVKGGRIQLDGTSGQFSSVNRHGRTFAIRNPFQQAIAFRNRFLRFLRGHNVQVPVSHAVCFPQVDETEFPAHVNIEPSILLGRTKLESLESSLAAVARSFHSHDFLKFPDVSSALDDLLVGATFKSRPLLREYMDSQEARVQELDALHETLVSPVSGVPRLGIEGEAGTGKTVLAANLARHFHGQNQKVMMMVSSPLLASHIANDVGAEIPVRSFQEFAASFGVNLLVAPSDFTTGGEQWIQYEAPERLRRAIEASDHRFDVLLIDEAQDVQPFWWVALEALLTSRNESRLYVFFDRGQGVFGGGEGASTFRPEDVLPVPANYICLAKNYRNTAEISQFARAFKRGHNVMSTSDRVGYNPSIIEYLDTPDAVQKLSALVKRLNSEHGILEDEIVILSARAPDGTESILSGVEKLGGLKVVRITTDAIRNLRFAGEGEIGVATIAAFKGLEAKIVIVVNLAEHKMPLENPIMSSLTYVAATRAKHMLYVFSKQNDVKHEKLLAATHAIRSGGSMILNSEDRPGEFVGRVIHHNPSRLSIIEMMTGEDVGKTVFALPADVQRSDVGAAVKQNALVRFRLRSEGGVATAISIALATDDSGEL